MVNALFRAGIIGLKFLVPALMLWRPFYFIWGNYFLDIVDGDVLQALGMQEYEYQTIDKAMDLVSYVFMLAVGWRWKIRKLVLGLFLYRMIGQIGFFITRNELMFVYFQNFLEPLMMAYSLLLFLNKTEEKAFGVYRRNLVLIWFIILAYKLWNEWYLHFANIDLSTLFFGIDGKNLPLH